MHVNESHTYTATEVYCVCKSGACTQAQHTACNLRESLACADDENTASLQAIVAYLYNEVPGAAWGSHSISYRAPGE